MNSEYFHFSLFPQFLFLSCFRLLLLLLLLLLISFSPFAPLSVIPFRFGNSKKIVSTQKQTNYEFWWALPLVMIHYQWINCLPGFLFSISLPGDSSISFLFFSSIFIQYAQIPNPPNRIIKRNENGQVCMSVLGNKCDFTCWNIDFYLGAQNEYENNIYTETFNKLSNKEHKTKQQQTFKMLPTNVMSFGKFMKKVCTLVSIWFLLFLAVSCFCHFLLGLNCPSFVFSLILVR